MHVIREHDAHVTIFVFYVKVGERQAVYLKFEFRKLLFTPAFYLLIKIPGCRLFSIWMNVRNKSSLIHLTRKLKIFFQQARAFVLQVVRAQLFRLDTADQDDLFTCAGYCHVQPILSADHVETSKLHIHFLLLVRGIADREYDYVFFIPLNILDVLDKQRRRYRQSVGRKPLLKKIENEIL